jgi:O-antigen/teichoic acid export membrane protein
MFTVFFSADIAGYYSLSHRILSLPMSLIGQSVSQAFFERAAKARNNAEELKRITLEIYKKLLLIGSIIMSFVLFYGDILFPFVFGKAWENAGRYAQWMSIWLVFNLGISPLSTICTVLEKQGEGFLINAILFISRAGVIIVTLIIGLSEIRMIAVFSIVGMIIYFGVAVHIFKLVNITFFTVIKSVIFTIVPVLAFQFVASLLIRSFL